MSLFPEWIGLGAPYATQTELMPPETTHISDIDGGQDILFSSQLRDSIDEGNVLTNFTQYEGKSLLWL